MKFRPLEASEIDLRVGSINEKGLSLLLYKDARADMNILDETVGCMNWKREHTRENANCIVSIWDSEKGQWISKEDTGAESFTEKEKGLASDSFKRACVNWGIGRELYTSPFIWIKAVDVNIKDRNGKKATYDKFIVTQIGYDDKRNITQLVIKNVDLNRTVFKLGQNITPTTPKENTPPASTNTDKSDRKGEKPLSDAQIKRLLAIANKKGYDAAAVKKMIQVKYNKTEYKALTKEEYEAMIKGFEGLEDKK